MRRIQLRLGSSKPGKRGAVNEWRYPRCGDHKFESPQLHQEVRANPSDFLRHRIARHSHVMKVTEGTPNQKINLRFAEGGVLVREEEPESVGPANIMDGRDTGSGGAVELDRSQVKAIAQKLF